MKTIQRVLATLPTLALVADQDIDYFSCTPTEYRFQLNFDGLCNGSTFIGAGVDGLVCYFRQGGDPSDIGGIRRLSQQDSQWIKTDRDLKGVDFTSNIEHAER